MLRLVRSAIGGVIKVNRREVIENSICFFGMGHKHRVFMSERGYTRVGSQPKNDLGLEVQIELSRSFLLRRVARASDRARER